MNLSLPEYIRRWKDSELTERAGSHSHFIDLCQILNEPNPAAADPTGHDYAFENITFYSRNTYCSYVCANVNKKRLPKMFAEQREHSVKLVEFE